jgi:hypothetical protein
MEKENGKTKTDSPGVVFREAPPVVPAEDTRKEILKARENTIKEMKEEVKPPPKIPPLSLYERLRGRPYSSEYFDLGNHWERWNFPKEITTIEDFVRGEIKKFKLNDSVESYHAILGTLEQRIGTRPTERVWHKMDRLVSYIRAITNERKWSERKASFEKGLNGETA